MRYLILIILFLSLAGISKNTQFLKPSSFKLQKRYQGEEYLHAIVTGDKSSLSKEQKQNLRDFSLLHLITPSGLHLSSLFIIQKIFGKRVYLLLMSFFTIFIFNLNGFYPLKRIMFFKGFKLLFRSMNNQMAFNLTFLLDLLVGFYQRSPFSSLLSMLFWGTILSHQKMESFSLIKKLFINSILVSLIFDQSLNAFSFILNPIYSFLISISFPFLLLSNLLKNVTLLPIELASWFLDSIFHLLQIINFQLFHICPDISNLCIVIALFKRWKTVTLISVLVCSLNLGEKYQFKYKVGKYLRPPIEREAI